MLNQHSNYEKGRIAFEYFIKGLTNRPDHIYYILSCYSEYEEASRTKQYWEGFKQEMNEWKNK